MVPEFALLLLQLPDQRVLIPVRHLVSVVRKGAQLIPVIIARVFVVDFQPQLQLLPQPAPEIALAFTGVIQIATCGALSAHAQPIPVLGIQLILLPTIQHPATELEDFPALYQPALQEQEVLPVAAAAMRIMPALLILLQEELVVTILTDVPEAPVFQLVT